LTNDTLLPGIVDAIGKSGQVGWPLISIRSTKSFCLMLACWRRIKSVRWPPAIYFDYLFDYLGP
jgi:hypothetical protein